MLQDLLPAFFLWERKYEDLRKGKIAPIFLIPLRVAFKTCSWIWFINTLVAIGAGA